MAKKIKEPVVTTKWNPPVTKAEIDNCGEVITVPNQTQSVRDILFKNTQGMTYDNYKTPYYEDQATFSSQPLNKIQEMEPVEKLQYLSDVKSQVVNLENKIKDFEQQKAQVVEQAKQVENVDKTAEQSNSE
jgi:hypothetical protein